MRSDEHSGARTVPGAGAAILLAPGERPPATAYDVALVDLDGVVYTGPAAIPGAARALAGARAAGMRLAFVTNNASRSPSAIAEHLRRLGIPAASGDVVTSAQAAASLVALRFPAGSPVLAAGAIGLRLALRERGMRPVSVAAEHPVAVVQGYAPDMSYALLAEAGVAVREGALFVAANADTTLPSPRGLQPGNGSMVAVIVTATGTRPLVAGKPEPPLHAEAVARTGARRPLVVGDRLETDIEGAVRGGADSMLVLTGVTAPADAVLAPPGRRPTYLAAGLDGLLTPQPAVGPGVASETSGATLATGQAGGSGTAWLPGTVGDGASGGALFRCGGWEVRRTGASGPIEITGGGEWIDGLRAVCAAAWSGGQITPEVAGRALEVLSRSRS